MIRVLLPHHLQTLARVGKEIELGVEQPATWGSVLDALEDQYPMLRGTIRDRITNQRRPFIRLFACGQDLSHEPLNTPLPEAVMSGIEPIRLVGAMAGG
jgi:sulfur-carrier protein